MKVINCITNCIPIQMVLVKSLYIFLLLDDLLSKEQFSEIKNTKHAIAGKRLRIGHGFIGTLLFHFGFKTHR